MARTVPLLLIMLMASSSSALTIDFAALPDGSPTTVGAASGSEWAASGVNFSSRLLQVQDIGATGVPISGRILNVVATTEPTIVDIVFGAAGATGVSFDWGSTASQSGAVEVSVFDAIGTLLSQTVESPGFVVPGFNTLGGSFSAGSSTVGSVRIMELASEPFHHVVWLDNVSFTAVPEPGTSVLVLTGLSALAAGRRRRG